MRSSDMLPSLAVASDADLVAACRAGDRQAFTQIVERYQRLLCSLAYSATGCVSESEDVAQETFVAAWRQLAGLREPEKLRSWLCGILRHQVSRHRRRDRREPVRRAEKLDAVGDVSSADRATTEIAMHHEEQTILWHVLEQVPPLYREPLILYYRESRSIEHVASALDLTEDAVKQRLARGRKMVQEQVLAFVEGALARSTPGRVFTLGVLAALPEFVTPAKAAVGFGAAAASHGSMLAKTTSIAAFLASITGVINLVLSLRAGLDQARTARERRVVVKAVVGSFVAAFGFLGVLYALRAASFHWWEGRIYFAWIAQAVILLGIVAWPIGMLGMLRRLRDLRSEERRLHPESFRETRDAVASSVGEYKSKARLFGVPLMHIRFAMVERGTPPQVGWIAAGDRAFGLLFAWGNIAVAPISVGVVSVGLLTVGALGFGVISLGTVAVGLLAVGCVTVGVKTYAWLSAVGWHTAQSGGFAIAGTAAEGPIAFARHANDPAARQILQNPNAESHQMIFLMLIVLLSLVPLVLYTREVRRRLR